MADNVTVPGTGVVIRTIDFGGGVEGQVIVLSDSSGNVIGSTLLTAGRGLNTAVLNDVAIKGKLAIGDVATTDRPVFVGGLVGAGIAQRDISVTSDSRFQALSLTADGRLLTLPIGPPEDQGLTTPVVAANDTNAHTLIPASGVTGIKLALWGLECVNLSATPTCVIVFNGATEAYRYAVPGNPGRPAYPQAGPVKSTANVALNYQLTTAVGANTLFLSPHYYITKQ